MDQNFENSFISANSLPLKIISNPYLIEQIRKHNILPLHIHINPTNKCPLDCSYCSCANRERAEEININELKAIVGAFYKLGTRAITITGGGEPLNYTYIDDIFDYFLSFEKNNLKLGLTTNGILMRKFKPEYFSRLTWCRISVSDEYKFSERIMDDLLSEKLDLNVDMSFSYVVSSNVDIEKLKNVIAYAKKNNFTHVRVVSNILDESIDLFKVREELTKGKIDLEKVIFHCRKRFSKGSKRCFVSLLKPNIDAAGDIYPCCGVQYAPSESSLTFDKMFKIGSLENLSEIYKNQQYFDGSICERCYYGRYNEIMGMIWDSDCIKHNDFI